MKDWSWQMVSALGIVAAAIVIMFVNSPDAETRTQLIGLFQAIVGLIVGAAAGGAIGWYRGWRVGKNI